MTKNSETVTGGNVVTPAQPPRPKRWVKLVQWGIVVYELLICLGRWLEVAAGHGSLPGLIFSHVCLVICIFFAVMPPLTLGRLLLRVGQFLHLR